MTLRVDFTEPLAGLGRHTAYDLDEVEGAPGLHALRAAADPELRLFALSADLVPGYAPKLSGPQLSTVSAEDAGDLQLLVVVNPTGDGPTVNLMAPLVLNPRTGQGTQPVLATGDWPLRHRLDGLSG
ncbi:hypothetical protein GCM10023081_09230 [Arthrobacter ginkgonis]|uniref:Flagellar assembly factor FliW n=1 Tax=Arthrobacter ginkgonis TaxID=1630594 RepID=A0ABP7C0W4_9MICC